MFGTPKRAYAVTSSIVLFNMFTRPTMGEEIFCLETFTHSFGSDHGLSGHHRLTGDHGFSGNRELGGGH
ncbi:hypothetical protein Pmar_PMAR001322 [Perkinsus marinus ATCC 50983]|uniref:Uncharacterized protein n=1 Tax=Perkinsus marinus (strain ATCC 50983 / TXsc) TaxID=423536 RepID=C5LZ75_PERM5|nr:hypothetical protein Pmar_PMAR001322 [Perkinsus marinus ATCC 50983]EEQ97964.1 hypothetical protein Pmar_PMAR001322 [Perkinsus marinus ATCC 50983]|eukprot:XP_002765247.1 hypothetical protein Pmar_PMAR001322 [Perkinsus marinus ATCC 50983]